MPQKCHDEIEPLAEVRSHVRIFSRRIGSRGSRWAVGSLSPRDCLADHSARGSLFDSSGSLSMPKALWLNTVNDLGGNG